MLALLFPGQGSQEVGMGRESRDLSRAARATFAAADAALSFPLSRLCFEGPEDELVRTEIQQPAILATSVALLRALEERGGPLSPVCVAGHSLGEYTALVAAGALDFEDAVRLVHARGRFMQEAVPEGRGAMAAVMGCAPAVVEAACAAAAAETRPRGVARQLQRPGADGDLGRRGGGRARLPARAPGGRAAHRAARGLGALPLRADGARRREARARARAGAVPRPVGAGRDQRRGRAVRRPGALPVPARPAR